MDRKLVIVAVAGLLASASSAFAQANGDLVFTDISVPNPGNPLSTQFVKWWQSGPNSVANIFSYANAVDPNGSPARPTVRLSDLTFGPNGSIFVGNGPNQSPGAATIGEIYRVDNPFGGAASSTTVASGGGVVQNPIGLQYDTASQRLLYINNPTVGVGQNPGTYAVDAGGTVTRLIGYSNDPQPRPGVAEPAYITPSPSGDGSYYIVSSNGGKYQVQQSGGPFGNLPANQNISSTVSRLTFPVAATANSGTSVITLDFADVGPVIPLAPLYGTNPTGNGTLAQVLTDVRGITSAPGNNLFVTDNLTGGIYRITLDNVGNYSAIAPIITGLQSPEAITYDAYSNTLVFSQIGTRTINRINLDGTGLSTVVTDVHVRGIRVVPTPAGAAVIGLGGLVALRRRRTA